MKKISIELKTIVFYILYVLTIFIAEKLAPSGVCTPGAGFLLFMLLIPISVIIFLKDLYKYYFEPIKSRLNSIFITIFLWIVICIILNFNLL